MQDAKPFDAYFDLATGQTNFGIVYYLCFVELERVFQKRPSCRVHIVLGPQGEFANSPRGKTYDRSQQLWRLYNLTLPATRLLPSVQYTAVHEDRNIVNHLVGTDQVRFPNDYDPFKPKPVAKFVNFVKFASKGLDVQPIEAPPFSKESIENWLQSTIGSRKFVTITLRQSDYQPERNSDIQNWLRAAEHIEQQGFDVVFVCDTEAVLLGKHGIPAAKIRCDIASVNLELRCALYELSSLNFFVGNGPATLALCNKKISYVMCNWIVEGFEGEEFTNKRFFELAGLYPNQIQGQKNPYAKIEWQDDDVDVIESAFDEWKRSAA